MTKGLQTLIMVQVLSILVFVFAVREGVGEVIVRPDSVEAVVAGTTCPAYKGLGTRTTMGIHVYSARNGVGIDLGKPRLAVADSGLTRTSGRTGISTGIAKSDTGMFGTGTEIGFNTESANNGVGIDLGTPHFDAVDTGHTIVSGRTGISTGIEKC